MSTIIDLLKQINNPLCLDKINWREELRGFDVNRIASIIIGIEDDYVCQQVARIIEVADYPEYFSSPRCAAYEKDDERILPYYLELFKRAGLHNAKSVSEAIGISMKLRQGEKEKREKIKRISEETRARCCTQKNTAGHSAPQAAKDPATQIAAGQPAETAGGFRSCILQKGGGGAPACHAALADGRQAGQASRTGAALCQPVGAHHHAHLQAGQRRVPADWRKFGLL